MKKKLFSIAFVTISCLIAFILSFEVKAVTLDGAQTAGGVSDITTSASEDAQQVSKLTKLKVMAEKAQGYARDGMAKGMEYAGKAQERIMNVYNQGMKIKDDVLNSPAVQAAKLGKEVVALKDEVSRLQEVKENLKASYNEKIELAESEADSKVKALENNINNAKFLAVSDASQQKVIAQYQNQIQAVKADLARTVESYKAQMNENVTANEEFLEESEAQLAQTGTSLDEWVLKERESEEIRKTALANTKALREEKAKALKLGASRGIAVKDVVLSEDMMQAVAAKQAIADVKTNLVATKGELASKMSLDVSEKLSLPNAEEEPAVEEALKIGEEDMVSDDKISLQKLKNIKENNPSRILNNSKQLNRSELKTNLQSVSKVETITPKDKVQAVRRGQKSKVESLKIKDLSKKIKENSLKSSSRIGGKEELMFAFLGMSEEDIEKTINEENIKAVEGAIKNLVKKITQITQKTKKLLGKDKKKEEKPQEAVEETQAAFFLDQDAEETSSNVEATQQSRYGVRREAIYEAYKLAVSSRFYIKEPRSDIDLTNNLAGTASGESDATVVQTEGSTKEIDAFVRYIDLVLADLKMAAAVEASQLKAIKNTPVDLTNFDLCAYATQKPKDILGDLQNLGGDMAAAVGEGMSTVQEGIGQVNSAAQNLPGLSNATGGNSTPAQETEDDSSSTEIPEEESVPEEVPEPEVDVIGGMG